MHEFVEPQLRLLLAEHLGIGAEQLVSGVSLREDLGVDSLDLVEVALLLETRFDVTLSDRVLADVGSYGELVDVTIGLLLERTADRKRPAASSPRVWARLRRSEDRAGGTLEHAGVLTPYMTETVIEHASLAGPGAQLEIGVAPGAGDDVLAEVHRRFALLAEQDVSLTVTIRCDDRTIAVGAADREPRSTRADRWAPAA